MKKIVSILLCIVFFAGNNVAQPLVFEAEDAGLTGGVSKKTYDNESCAYMEGSGSITFQINLSEAGSYKLTIRAGTPLGEKTQDLYVNNVHSGQVKFIAADSLFNTNAGSIHLNAGENAIEIRKNWGWMYFDKISLELTPENDYSQTSDTLINSGSNENTRNVYAYLRSQYGNKIISGQTFYWNELLEVAEKIPVVRAFDFQTYTVGYSYLWDNTAGAHTFGWYDNGTTTAAINWYNSTDKMGIVSFQWHWHSPSGGQAGTNTFYTNSTTFDVSKAVIDGTDENIAVIRDIDSIATQLHRLQSAGIPVLWRPLHEAGGKWFWWGAKTADDCKLLYDIVYNRLINHHNLSNLIWVWSTPEPDWYPGNHKVDIIGFDSYPGDYVYSSQKAVFNQLYDIVEGKKMVAMTENGPIPDIDKCIEEDAMWLYFSSWSDLVVKQNSEEHIKEVFSHPNVLTLGDYSSTIENSKSNLGFTIYPSPANEFLYISITDNRYLNGTINIITVEGKIIQKVQLGSYKNSSINISHLPAGIYLCKVECGEHIDILKFIKN